MASFFKAIIYYPLYNALIFFAWLIPGHSIGWAIVALTTIVRLILLPASLKAAHAQAKLQLLQPKINEIRDRVKDQTEQAKDIMALYKAEKVSPFGSCLPMLIQLPIIWVLYTVFRNGLDTSGFANLYSFVPHLDTVNTYFFGLNLVNKDPWILPILAGATQFVLSRMTMPKPQPKVPGKEVDPMQMATKQMVYMLPVMTIFIGRSMPAALVIYWIATTIFGIAQQYYVNKIVLTQKKEIEAEIKEDMPLEIKRITESPKTKETPKKKDFMANMISKRLDKQEKKTGVNVTVRTKK